MREGKHFRGKSCMDTPQNSAVKFLASNGAVSPTNNFQKRTD